MNHIFNEYLTTESVEIYRHKFLLTYSQLDHMPTGTIRGSVVIMSNHITVGIVNFNLRQEGFLDYELLTFSPPKHGVKDINYNHIHGMQILWDCLPIDHYISISYDFKDCSEISKIDWRKEGF